MLKHDEQCCKKFWHCNNQFEHPTYYNYFDNPTKLFSDLYLDKFLNALAKLFLPCKIIYAIKNVNEGNSEFSIKITELKLKNKL